MALEGSAVVALEVEEQEAAGRAYYNCYLYCPAFIAHIVDAYNFDTIRSKDY